MVDTILSKLSAKHWMIIGAASFILVCFFIFFQSQFFFVFVTIRLVFSSPAIHTLCIKIILNSQTHLLANTNSFIFRTVCLSQQDTGVTRQLHLQEPCVASSSRDEIWPHICTVSDSSRLAKSTWLFLKTEIILHLLLEVFGSLFFQVIDTPN